jgi:hypothetical protein
MAYEITVALNGSHLFSTHERSATTKAEALRIAKILTSKFPESEGYQLFVSFDPQRSYGCDMSSFLDEPDQLLKAAYSKR